MKKVRLTLVLNLIAIIAFAQGYKISGTIIDADDTTGMTSANVVLSNVTDTAKWQGAVADLDGKFEFSGVESGTYKLKVRYLGYTDLERMVTISNSDVTLGTIKLSRNAKQLKEVDIVEQQIRVEQKADTVEYNAKAFKTNPDATAEDLVVKMPGVTREDGVVKAQGEEVKKVTIDGKDFFGDDASMALKNLPSDVVDRVQVFDRMSDQAQFTGFDDGNSMKSMNIVTKNGISDGVFGKVYAGYGYLNDSKYTAGFNINWFKENRRLTFLGMSNNINQQNFSMDDLVGVTGNTSQRGGGGMGGPRGGGGGRGPMGGGGAASNFLVGQQNGISTSHAAGINYADVWGKLKKVQVTGSYFFNLADNATGSDLQRQYFNTGDTSTYYKENNDADSRNINHRFNFRLQYNIDSMNSLIFTPRLSVQQNYKTSNTFGQTTNPEGTLLSQSNSRVDAYNLGYNFSTELLYRHKFNKPRRTISFSVTPTINNRKGNSSQLSENLYAGSDTSIIDQETVSSSNNYSIAGNITYTEPAGKTGMVQLNYDGSYAWNMADKQTSALDSVSNEYNVLDTLLSNKYDNNYMTQRAGATYRVNIKSASLSVGVNGQYALLTGTSIFPYSYNTNRSFYNVLPNAMFSYKFKKGANIRVMYRTSTNPPSISQLQSVIDNSNPLLLSTGNPNLKQTYTHNAFVRFGYTNTKTAQSFFTFASVNYTENYIGNSTIIAAADTTLSGGVLLPAGGQLSMPVNLSGNLSANLFMTYGLPVKKIKSNMNLNAGLTYSRTPSMINMVENMANTYGVSGGFVLSSNISEKIDFTIMYRGGYNIVKNSINRNSDNNYYSHTADVRFNWMFWKGFVFNTTLQNTLYAGIAQGYNQNIFLWNAGLGYKFLKDKSLEVRFSVNDILNQNNGIARTVTDTYIEDSQTQVLKRYLMLTVTYNLRFFKNKGKG